MNYRQGTDRNRIQLLPPSIEDYVHPQAPVRVIDVFVNDLDLAKPEFTKTSPALMGRPAYDPRGLLTLHLYGCLHRVRSSR